MGQMRSSAQIGKLSLLVKRDGPVFKFGNHLHLIGFILIKGQGLGFGYFPALDGQPGLYDFFHLGLYFLEVIFGDRFHIDIVIKPVLHHGANG